MAWPIYEVIAEHKLPAVFHSGHSGIGSGMRCGGGLRLQNSNPMLLEDVAIAFPDMQIVVAHPSWPWQDEAISLAMHKPNIWIDLSGWSPKYFPPQLVQYANTLLKDRILFGSDFPLITPDRWLKDFEEAGFKDEVQAADPEGERDAAAEAGLTRLRGARSPHRGTTSAAAAIARIVGFPASRLAAPWPPSSSLPWVFRRSEPAAARRERPAASAAAHALATASSTPTSLRMRDDGSARQRSPTTCSLPRPRPAAPTTTRTIREQEAEPATSKLPADPQKQVDLLADAIAKTQDAVKRDKLVRALRDAVAKIQPVMSDKDAKKQIDKAIDSLIESGSKKLLLDLITAIVGKGPSQQPDPDKPHPVGPNMKEKDLGEHIFKSPEIPIGKPPAVHRNSFEFRGLPKTARPELYVSFKLVTPDWFDPGKTPGSWVMIMTPADHAANKLGGNDTDVHIDGKGTLDLSMRMPDDPGSYVIVIKIQSGFEDYPVEEIEVKK